MSLLFTKQIVGNLVELATPVVGGWMTEAKAREGRKAKEGREGRREGALYLCLSLSHTHSLSQEGRGHYISASLALFLSPSLTTPHAIYPPTQQQAAAKDPERAGQRKLSMGQGTVEGKIEGVLKGVRRFWLIIMMIG